MNCCVECFKDEYIKNIIYQQSEFGNCDFCASKSTNVYTITANSDNISDLFTSILQLYIPSHSINAKELKISIRDDWDIFNLGQESIIAFLKNVCIDIFNNNKDIFTEKVIIPEIEDKDYLKEYGVVHGNTWTEFSSSIKTKNRFHSKMFNSDIFASFLSVVSKIYPIGEIFFRARITYDKTGYDMKDMGSPPKGKSSPGRINPEGISVLYVASDTKTVLNEVRATTFDYVSIGEFRVKKEIKVVNLSAISRTSPFLYISEIEKYFVNRTVFQEMANDFAKPLRRNDSPLEYLPTQYIAEFIKSEGYDGVQYDSTLVEGGYNIAVFDVDLLECVNTNTVEVSKIIYETLPKIE